jgi:DNA-binding response OmpR family regulator
MVAQDKSGGPVILVVDEESQIRDGVCEHLGQHGFATLDAADTDAALALLRRHPEIRGAVVDARLPGSVSALELMQRMRKDRPDVAVIMVSGHSDHVSGPIPEGCEFLNKPNLSEELVPMLRRLLKRDGASA